MQKLIEFFDARSLFLIGFWGFRESFGDCEIGDFERFGGIMKILGDLVEVRRNWEIGFFCVLCEI
jgi:hypothetical protein